ncbi:MAG: hypothetical protein ABGX40_05605 [Methylococcales bacterium]
MLIGMVVKALGDALHFAIGQKDHKIDAGDILVVMGPSQEIKVFKKEVCYVSAVKI